MNALIVLLIGLALVFVSGLVRARKVGDLFDEVIFGFQVRITRQMSLNFQPPTGCGLCVEVLPTPSVQGARHYLALHFVTRHPQAFYVDTSVYVARVDGRLRCWWASSHIAVYFGKRYDNSDGSLATYGPTDWWQYNGWLGSHMHC